MKSDMAKLISEFDVGSFLVLLQLSTMVNNSILLIRRCQRVSLVLYSILIACCWQQERLKDLKFSNFIV